MVPTISDLTTDSLLKAEYDHIKKVEQNLIDNFDVIKKIFDIPEGMTVIKIRVDGLGPRKDGAIVWKHSQAYRIEVD